MNKKKQRRRRHAHGGMKGIIHRVVDGVGDALGIGRGLVIAGFVVGFVFVPLLSFAWLCFSTAGIGSVIPSRHVATFGASAPTHTVPRSELALRRSPRTPVRPLPKQTLTSAKRTPRLQVRLTNKPQPPRSFARDSRVSVPAQERSKNLSRRKSTSLNESFGFAELNRVLQFQRTPKPLVHCYAKLFERTSRSNSTSTSVRIDNARRYGQFKTSRVA